MSFLPLLAAAILQAAASQAALGPRADFSGVWTLDPARSETLTAGGQIERRVVVTHSGASFRVAPAAAGETVVTFPIVEAAARAGSPGAAYWDGPALVTERQGTINGKSVTIKQSRRLTPGGAEMEVDTTVAIQHGYAEGEPLPQSKAHDVYVRAR